MHTIFGFYFLLATVVKNEVCMSKRVLSLVQLPPPIHGAAVMNEIVVSCFDNAVEFKNATIVLRFSKTLSDLRKPSLFKLYSAFGIFYKVLVEVVFRRPDLVYFTLTPTGAGFIRDCFYVVIIKMFGLKMVYHLHGKGVAEFAKKSPIVDYLYKFIFHNVNTIILAAELHQDISRYIGMANVIVIPNGLDCFSSKVQLQASDESVIKFCFLSNLVKGKGILDFLEAFYVVYQDNILVQAIVIGDFRNDGTAELVKSFLHERGADFSGRVEFRGALYSEKKYLALSSADIFVFPTFIDTFPLVLIEAMASGLPCVVYDEGATSSMIRSGCEGIVVKKGRTDLLANAMADLVNNPTLMRELGNNSRARYELHYTRRRFEERMMDAVLNLI